jgi:hypothetical protein
MIEPLSEAQQRWVDAICATLRTEDKVAQHDLRLSDQMFASHAVFVNCVFKGMWGVQSVRSVGTHNRNVHPPARTASGPQCRCGSAKPRRTVSVQ